MSGLQVERCPQGHPVLVSDMQEFIDVASDDDLQLVLAGGAECDDCRRIAREDTDNE